MSRLDKPSKYLAYLGAAVLFLMMLLTTVDVASRYLFNSPILGALEITEFMVVTVVFSFLGLTQQEKGHVAVDLVLGNLPYRSRRLVNFLNRLAGLFILGLVTWKTFERALELMHMHEYSGTLHIPVAPFVFLVALGCGAMCLELTRQMFTSEREEN